MNFVTMRDSDTIAVLYFSDDGSGAALTQFVDLTTLRRSTGGGADRMIPTQAWWTVDGSVTLDVDDGTGGGTFVPFMDFAGNSKGWVNLPAINANDIAGVNTTGDFQVNNATNVSFSLCIKFEKRSGFSERPRLHSNDRAFDTNR
jgi:hypothetical protein